MLVVVSHCKWSTQATIDRRCIFQMYSPKYSKAQSCAYFCSKNVLVALNTLYIVSTLPNLLIMGDPEAAFRELFWTGELIYLKAFSSLRGILRLRKSPTVLILIRFKIRLGIRGTNIRILFKSSQREITKGNSSRSAQVFFLCCKRLTVNWINQQAIFFIRCNCEELFFKRPRF